MRTSISYWSKMNWTDADKCVTHIYIVPMHGALPPVKDKDQWVPVTVTYEDRPFERFVESCRTHGYTFLSEHEVRDVTGIRQIREFGPNIFIIVNHNGDKYWNGFYKWMDKLSDASRYTAAEADNVIVPENGEWLQLC